MLMMAFVFVPKISFNQNQTAAIQILQFMKNAFLF